MLFYRYHILVFESTEDCPLNSHRYSAQLRITGSFVPDEITRLTGLTPNLTRSAGSTAHGREQQAALWSYSGEPGGTFVKEFSSLEDAVTALLEKVEPEKPFLQPFIKKHRAVWWCAHFQSSFDGGPLLSPMLLSRLGDFGVALYLDNYFSDDGRSEDL